MFKNPISSAIFVFIVVIILSVAIGYYKFIKKQDAEKEMTYTIATVNGEKITIDDFKLQSRISETQYGSFEKINPEELKQLKLRILKEIITRILLLQEARKRDLVMTKKELDKELRKYQEGYGDIKYYMIELGNKIDRDTLLNELNDAGFVESINEKLKIKEFSIQDNHIDICTPYLMYPVRIITNKNGIVETIFSLQENKKSFDSVKIYEENEFKNQIENLGITYAQWYKYTMEQLLTRKLIEKEVFDKITVNEEEIDMYYNNNKDKFQQDQLYEISQIVVKTKKEAYKIWRLLRYRKKTFEECAKKYSIMPESQKGGYLGFISLQHLPRSLEKYITSLSVKRYTKPHNSPYGWHIIKLHSVTEHRFLSLKEAHDQINNIISNVKRKEQLKLWLKKIKNSAKITLNNNFINSMESID